MSGKNRHAVILGRRGGLSGGKVRSEAKAAACRQNGLKGGRRPVRPPVLTYRGVDVRQDQRGRYWGRRQSGRLGIRETYRTQAEMVAAIDQLLDAPPAPACEVCGVADDATQAFTTPTTGRAWVAHTTCLRALQQRHARG